MQASSGISVGPDGVARCWWSDSDDIYRRYHDLEWGRPVANDRELFEKLSLDGFQSGLSWLIILRKRENFRAAFRNFEPAAVARFEPRDIARLMDDRSIIRNRAKIEATVNNARRMPDLIAELGSFAAYVWRFEPEPRRRSLSRSHSLGDAVSRLNSRFRRDVVDAGVSLARARTLATLDREGPQRLTDLAS